MNLGEYYSLQDRYKNANDLYAEIKNSATAAFSTGPTLEDCQRLRAFLKAAFYPDNPDNSIIYQRVKNIVQQYYEKIWNIKLNDFNMAGGDDGNISYSGLDEVPGIIRDLYDRDFTHTQRIKMTTIEKRLESVKQYLNNLSTASQLAALEGPVGQLKNSLESLATEMTDSKGWLILKDDPGLLKRVQEMDGLYQALSSVGTGVFSPEQLGEVLEVVLQALGGESNNIADSLGEQITDEFIASLKNGRAGQENVALSSERFLNYKIGFEETYGKINGTGNLGWRRGIFKTGSKDSNMVHLDLKSGAKDGGHFSFDYNRSFNPNGGRQGKMDVNFVLGDGQGPGQTFRISAKNWNKTGDFGETPLAYALLRSSGLQNTSNYAYIMQDEKIDITDAHNFAKLAILLDILMGYSQTQNYADTVVINLRSISDVIVFSLKEILKNVINNIENFSPKGYQSATVHAHLVKIRKILKSDIINRSEAYEAIAMRYLQSIKTTITYQNIVGFAS